MDETMEGPAGRIEHLHRYPVKSLLGERLDRASIDTKGIAGDRRMALLDTASGKIASAKHPALWAGLLACRARPDADGIEIVLPGGRAVRAGSAEADAALSALLGREVRIVDTPPQDATVDRADPDALLESGAPPRVPATLTRLGAGSPPGTFFDFAPIHFVTTATLEHVAQLAGRTLDAIRYRPNLVVRTPAGTPPFVENQWIGRLLALSGGVRLKVVVPTPRCAVPTLDHGGLGTDLEALRVAVRHNRVQIFDLGRLPCLGAYAQVVASGSVAAGDEVSLSDG